MHFYQLYHGCISPFVQVSHHLLFQPINYIHSPRSQAALVGLHNTQWISVVTWLRSQTLTTQWEGLDITQHNYLQRSLQSMYSLLKYFQHQHLVRKPEACTICCHMIYSHLLLCKQCCIENHHALDEHKACSIYPQKLAIHCEPMIHNTYIAISHQVCTG